MPTIHTPVKGYTGTIVGVQFKDGTGETEDQSALSYFARKGYTIDGAPTEPADFDDDTPAGDEPQDFDQESEDEGEQQPEDEDAKDDDRPAKSATKGAWVDYALANGKTGDDVDGLNKDELIALFTEHQGE